MANRSRPPASSGVPDWRPMLGDILNYTFLVLAVIALLGMVVVVSRPDLQRQREDDARAFFDEHGHWPDEPPPR